MSQHDMNIENQGFPAFRSDLNNALAALASTSAGATAPSTTFAQQLWYDSTNNLLKMRNTDNDAWITLAYFDQTNDEWEVRSAVIQAVDSAGVTIKTNDGVSRISVGDGGNVTFANDVTINGDLDVQNHAIDMGDNTTSVPIFTYNTNPTTANATIGQMAYEWNGNKVIAVEGKSGTDTTNKDNGVFQIRVAESGDLNAGGLFVLDHNGNAGFGTSNPDSAVHAVSNNQFRFERQDTDTNRTRNIFRIKHKTSGNMSDGFGASLAFEIEDSGASSEIAHITAIRSGSDSSGALVFQTNSTQDDRMIIDSAGSVLLRTTTWPGNANNGGAYFRSTAYDRMELGLAHTDSSQRTLVNFFGNASTSSAGNIKCDGTSTQFNTSSDYRLKENVVDMTGAIDRLKELKPSQFNWIMYPDRTVDGFLAHEVQSIVPEAVSGEKDGMEMQEYQVSPALGEIYIPATEDADEKIISSDVERPETLEEGQQWRETTAAVMGEREVPDYQAIDQSKLVPLLTGALQEAIAKIEALETRIAALEA